MRVLIADDSKVMRKIITGAIKRFGIDDVVEACDGVEAVEKVAEDADIGLVLMDWNMPNMTGIEALKKIRDINAKLPIIMVTTEAEKGRVIEAIRFVRTNDYIIKPFSPRDIQTKMEKFM